MTYPTLLRHLTALCCVSIALGACAAGHSSLMSAVADGPSLMSAVADGPSLMSAVADGPSLMSAVADGPSIMSAVADGTRPAVDQARDADRKPEKMLAFARLKPGQTVVDYLPGKGYFTRLFSTTVGASGAVYAVTPQLYLDTHKGATLPSIAGEPGRGNVHDIVAPDATLGLPVQVDLVWTSQNYHDVHVWGGPEAAARLNAAVLQALKPGGLYVVLDHAGPAGLDEAGIKKLHRIDQATVIREVEAAGFEPDGASDVLRNPSDPHTANVFDPTIRGKTDQFLLRFRKPRK